MSDNAQTQAITRVTPSKDVVDWYRDAVIYQTHVRAFFDANGDGIGDFPGLTHASITLPTSVPRPFGCCPSTRRSR